MKNDIKITENDVAEALLKTKSNLQVMLSWTR